MNKKMVVAALILVLVFLSLVLVEVLYPTTESVGASTPTLVISGIAEIVLGPYVVVIVAKHLLALNSVGIWSLVWRSLVVRYAAHIAAVLLHLVLLPKPNLPSTRFTLELYAILFFLVPLFAWVIFSKTRMSDLRRFLPGSKV
jgi:hypothetical protein